MAIPVGMTIPKTITAATTRRFAISTILSQRRAVGRQLPASTMAAQQVASRSARLGMTVRDLRFRANDLRADAKLTAR